MVMGFSLVIFAVFRGFYVPLLQDFLDAHDWRQVMVMLGLVMGLIVFPVMWLFLRDRPEQFGLLPDGVDERKPTTVILDEDNWTLAEARRTMLFWVFTMGRVLSPAWGTGLIFHQVSIFEELGYGPGVAADTLGRVAFVAAGVTLLAGYMVDRLHPARVLAFQLIGLIGTMGLAMIMSEAWMLPFYALAFGTVHGNGGVIDGAVFANVYGRQHQGAIRGFLFTFIVAGSAVGPILFGLSYDYLGSYNPILWAGIALAIIPLVLSFFTPMPQHEHPTE
jgi:sugar phosphate permease